LSDIFDIKKLVVNLILLQHFNTLRTTIARDDACRHPRTDIIEMLDHQTEIKERLEEPHQPHRF
jgi:hypothetical protein